MPKNATKNMWRLLSLALRFSADAVSEVSPYSPEHAFAAGVGLVWSQHILTCMPKAWCDLQHGVILPHPKCELTGQGLSFKGKMITLLLA